MASTLEMPQTKIYMYTDRPVYRPGQTVHFRGIARQAFNGRYERPTVNDIPIILRDANGMQLLTINAQLSPYGTFNGEYQLPDYAAPGYYVFENSSLELYFNFQVAEYRKPEINLGVTFSANEIKLGDAATAQANARYFFDAPVANADVHWAFYTRPSYFDLPNYQTSVLNTSWLDVFQNPEPDYSTYFGSLIKEGTGQTDADGILSVELPAIPERDAGQLITLEVTATDESGLPVSARTQMLVHPADFYAGLRPDQWTGTAKQPLGFDMYTVDWAKNASGDRELVAESQQYVGKTVGLFGFQRIPGFTPISSATCHRSDGLPGLL